MHSNYSSIDVTGEQVHEDHLYYSSEIERLTHLVDTNKSKRCSELSQISEVDFEELEQEF